MAVDELVLRVLTNGDRDLRGVRHELRGMGVEVDLRLVSTALLRLKKLRKARFNGFAWEARR